MRDDGGMSLYTQRRDGGSRRRGVVVDSGDIVIYDILGESAANASRTIVV